VELAVRWPAETPLSALGPLRGVVRDAGGRVEEEAADEAVLLRLGLPRSAAVPE
jgi:hypothetical protein